LIAGVLLIGIVVYETNKLKALSEQSFHNREEKFKATPNIIDGMVLMHNSWERKEYKKTLDYAQYCTKIGIDNTKRAWLVHILMASAYYRTGNQEKACYQANLAMTLAQRDHVPDEYLEHYGLKEVLGSCSMELAKP
jgi:hypothetical protein